MKKDRCLLTRVIPAIMFCLSVVILIWASTPLPAQQKRIPTRFDLRARPDLVIQKLSVKQGKLVRNPKVLTHVQYMREVIVTFVVKNIGTRSTADSLTAAGVTRRRRGGFTVNAIYYFVEKKVDVPKLDPGQYKQYTVSHLVPVGNSHYYQIVADWHNEINEKDEMNNEAFQNLTTTM